MSDTADRPYRSPGHAAYQRWLDEQQPAQTSGAAADWTEYSAYYVGLTRAEQHTAWTDLTADQQTDYQAWLDTQAVPGPSAAPAPQPPAVAQPVHVQAPQRQLNIENAFSLRVVWAAGWAAILLGGGAAYLLSRIAAPLGYSAWVLVPLVFVVTMAAMVAGPPVTCPQCRKRIKANATRCHHCGVSYA